MKATIREDGTLVLMPESGLEAYAAKLWAAGERNAEVMDRAEISAIVPRREKSRFSETLRNMAVGETVYFEPNGSSNMRGSIWGSAKTVGVTITTKARDGGIEVTRTA